jgi:hypothetical protein
VCFFFYHPVLFFFPGLLRSGGGFETKRKEKPSLLLQFSGVILVACALLVASERHEQVFCITTVCRSRWVERSFLISLALRKRRVVGLLASRY